MATYELNETTSGNDSGSNMTDQGEVTLKANRSWQVLSSAEGGRANYVRDFLQSFNQLPRLGDIHPDHPLMTCRDVSVKRESPIYYTASAAYQSIAFPAGSDSESVTYPWELPAKVNYRSVSSEALTDEDYDGNVIANPVTDEVVEGITKRVSDVTAVVKRSFVVFSGPVIRTFMDQVNSDTYLGFSPGEGMVQSISADSALFEDITYYDVTAEILFRTPYRTTSDKAWYHRRAIRGFYEMKLAFPSEKRIRAVDEEKQPVTQPVLLDDDGHRIESGGAPIWRDTKLYGTIAFSGMGFF